jgi:hypothetical protein
MAVDKTVKVFRSMERQIMHPDNTLQGIIHGRVIELFEDPGVPDGERVVVQLQRTDHASAARRDVSQSAGEWADFPEMDEIMTAIERDRANDAREEVAF